MYMTVRSQKIIQNVLTSVVLLLFLFSVARGFFTGRDVARAGHIAANANSIMHGLDLFYNDQNRYPANEEFWSRQVMGEYFDNFPPLTFIQKNCGETYGYSSYRQLSFELTFCLPRAHDFYISGKNVVTEKTPFSN